MEYKEILLAEKDSAVNAFSLLRCIFGEMYTQ